MNLPACKKLYNLDKHGQNPQRKITDFTNNNNNKNKNRNQDNDDPNQWGFPMMQKSSPIRKPNSFTKRIVMTPQKPRDSSMYGGQIDLTKESSAEYGKNMQNISGMTHTSHHNPLKPIQALISNASSSQFASNTQNISGIPVLQMYNQPNASATPDPPELSAALSQQRGTMDQDQDEEENQGDEENQEFEDEQFEEDDSVMNDKDEEDNEDEDDDLRDLFNLQQ